ncbi:hypothetical protein ACLBYG_04785 [Methylobacterium sp. D53M]
MTITIPSPRGFGTSSGLDDARIYLALLAFLCRYRAQPGLFRSFAVLFDRGRPAGRRRSRVVRLRDAPDGQLRADR